MASIAPSTIPGAGRGAFAARDLKAGEWLAPYYGVRYYRSNAPGAVCDQVYALAIGLDDNPLIINSYNDTVGNWTRYVNDAEGPVPPPHGRGNNCEFVERGGGGWLRVLYPIARGEELFVGYGAEYWGSALQK